MFQNNQNDNRQEISNNLKETGKQVVRKTNKGVKRLFNRANRKFIKKLGKGISKLFKGISNQILKVILALAKVSAPILLIILMVVLLTVSFVMLYNEGMLTGVMQELGLATKEEKEAVILEDKYWQMISDRSYYQESNQYGIKTNAIDEISQWVGEKTEKFTPFINWQAEASQTANGRDSSLIPASSFYVLDVDDYKRDYYNRENNYLLPFYLLKELNNTLLQSNEMAKGYPVIYPEQFLKTPYHVEDYMRIDKDGKEFVWVKEDKDGNQISLSEGSMVYDYKVREYNPSEYFKAKDDTLNYGMPKSYVYNNLSSFEVKKINRDLNDFNSALENATEKTGVEFDLLKALMIQESGGNPKAGKLRAGYGLFQIENTQYNDATWTRYSGGALNIGVQISGSDATKDERSDPSKSALWAGDHLQSLINRYDGDTLKGLQAYNFGAGGVDRLVKEYGDEWINNRDQLARLLGKEKYGDPNYLEHVLQYYNGDLSAPTLNNMSNIVRIYYKVDTDGNPIVEDDMQVPQTYRQLAPLTDEKGDIIAISTNRFNYQEKEDKVVFWTDSDEENINEQLSSWVGKTQTSNYALIQSEEQELREAFEGIKLQGEQGVDWNLVKDYKDKPISEAESSDFRFEFINNNIVDRAEIDSKYRYKNSLYAWNSQNNQVVYRENWRLGDPVPTKKNSVKDWGIASMISYITDQRVEYNSGLYIDEKRNTNALQEYIQSSYNPAFSEVYNGFYPTTIEIQDDAQKAQKNLEDIDYFNELEGQGITKTVNPENFDKNGKFTGNESFDNQDINEKINVYGPYVGLADFSIFSNPPTKVEQLEKPEEFYHFWYDSINGNGLSNLFRDVQMQDKEVNANANLKALKEIDTYEAEKEKIEDRGAIYFSHPEWTEEINLIDKATTYIGNFLNAYDVKATSKRALTQNEQTAVLEAYTYNRHWKATNWNVQAIREITTSKLVTISTEDGSISHVELNEPFEVTEDVTKYFDNTNPNLKFYTNSLINNTEYDESNLGQIIFRNGFIDEDYKTSFDLVVPDIQDSSFIDNYDYVIGLPSELGYERSEITGYKLTLNINDNRNKGEVGYILRHYSGEIKEVMPQPNESYLDGVLVEDIQKIISPENDEISELERVEEIMKHSKYLQDYYTNFEAWVSMNALDEFNHYEQEVGEIYYEEITTLEKKSIPSSVHSYFSIFEKSLDNWNFWTFFKTGLSRKDSEVMLTELLMSMASYEQEYGSNKPLRDEFGEINSRVGFMNIYSDTINPTMLNATDDLGNVKNLISYNLNCSLDKTDDRLDTIKSIKYVSSRIHNLTKYYGDLLKGLMAYKIGVPTMDKLIKAHPDTWHSRPSDEIYRLMDEVMPTDYVENTNIDKYYIQRVLSYISNPDDVVKAMTTDTGFLTESIRNINHGTGELINTVDKLIGPEYDVYDNYGGYEIENHKSFFNFELTLKKIVGMATGATNIDKVKLDLFKLIGKGTYLSGETGGMAGDLSFFKELIYNVDDYVLPVQIESPRLTSPFGYRKMNHPTAGLSIRRHNGIDIAEPFDTPIYSIANGKVNSSGYSDSLGNFVIIKHFVNPEETQYFLSYYAHLNNSTPYVQTGDNVKSGQLIGLMGSSGASTGSHLHFAIKATGITPENEKWEQWEPLFWEGERWINPYYFISGTQNPELEDKYKNARSLQEAISDYDRTH